MNDYLTSRRTFMKRAAASGAAAAVFSRIPGCERDTPRATSTTHVKPTDEEKEQPMAYPLPDLPYAFDAL